MLHSEKRYLINVLAVVFANLALCACVSDTLSQQNTQPKPITAQNTSYDPIARENAVAEIRAKAADSGSGELTSAYVTNDGPTSPLSPEEQAAKIAELEQSAGNNSGQISDDELNATQQSIKDLQNKARTHYNSALNSIQN